MTIEDEARAAAIERYSSRVIEDYDGDRYDEDEYGYDATARSAFVKGALWAASRREPSDTDERWEYGVRDDAPTSYYGTIVPTADLDEANFGASVDDRMTPVRRRKAGPWEVVPDEG